MLEWGAALGHVGADGVVVHITCELEVFILFEVFFSDNDLILVVVLLVNDGGVLIFTGTALVTAGV